MYLKEGEEKIINYFSNDKNLDLLEKESNYPVIYSEKSFFPDNKYDEFKEPLDLRPENTWTLKLEEIDTFELIEVHIINSIVPFIFASKLKKLMEKSEFKDKFIINVSSSEGQFSYPNKSTYHPHNNMSKASLNMLTRTSANDYAENNIFINSIDVGWVSSGNPFEKKQRLEDDGFVHPLDLIDAAARIYDPIIQGILGNIFYGKLIKNYKEVDW
ncbi:MAG: SDR family oxidoreductase [Candidatus Sericytochromatia bacterium]